MNEMSQNKSYPGTPGKRPAQRDDSSREIVRLHKNDAASLVQRIRQEATDHPYRTIGVATLAGVVLSSRVGRALAGWAGLRLGWDLLVAVMRDQGQDVAENTN